MAEETHERPRRFYVTGPEGRPPTEDEALEMGGALFDAIVADRARQEEETSPPP